MNSKAIDFLRRVFPFALTLFLWRLGSGWFNPGGMLALIPIFYCTFIRPTPWFAPFAVLMCFMIDYKSDTLLYWTAVFGGCYAAYNMQTAVDFSQAAHRGVNVFAAMFASAVVIISLPHITGFANFLRMAWTIAWGCAMYVPLTLVMERVADD